MTVADGSEARDLAELFVPAARRERLVDWQAPGPVEGGRRHVGAGSDVCNP